MKISTASKKVLASALSAAMVVAFAPTVAMADVKAAADPTAKLTVVTHNATTGAQKVYEKSYYNVEDGNSGLKSALADVATGKVTLEKTPEIVSGGVVTPAVNEVMTFNTTNLAQSFWDVDGDGTFDSGDGDERVTVDSVVVTMLADTEQAIDYTGNVPVTVDLGGKTLSNEDADTAADEIEAALETITTAYKAAQAADPTDPYAGAATYNSAIATALPSGDADYTTTFEASGTGAVTIQNGTVAQGFAPVYTKATSSSSPATIEAASEIEAIAGAAKLKNVTIESEGSDAATGIAALEASTATKKISGAITSVKGGTYGLVASAFVAGTDKTVTVEGATFAGLTAVVGTASDAKVANITVKGEVVSKSEATKTANALAVSTDGTVTVTKGASLTATAVSAKDSMTATAVSGDVELKEKATLTAEASATGEFDHNAASAAAGVTGEVDASADESKATVKAVFGGKYVNVDASTTPATVYHKILAKAIGTDLTVGKKAAAAVTAESLDADASAAAVAGTADVLGAAEVTADGYYKAGATDTANIFNSYAVGTINSAAAGTFTGLVKAWTASTSAVTGGKFTTKVPETSYKKTNYELVDDGTYYTVQQFNGYVVKGAADDITDAVAAALNSKEGAATLAMAEGVTMADLQAQSKTTAGLTLYRENGAVSEKKATDAQKAAVKAIQEWAKANCYVEPTYADVNFVSYYVGYKAEGATTPTVMATLKDFGSTKDGRTLKANTLTLDNNVAANEGVVVFDGTNVVAQTPTRNAADTAYEVKAATVPGAYATLTIDIQAVKDAAEKGEQAAETITDPAVMAAIVQLQDQNAVLQVEGKSKTVKKGKSATIKLGVPASASGAKVTFKKANTAGKKNITVSKAGTVTVKKALKKGTYKVKVKATCGASFKNVLVKIVKK